MKIFRKIIYIIASRTVLFNIFNFTIKRKYYKHKIKIPVIKQVGLNNIFISEFWMIDLFKILIPLKHGLFIDVGANTGQTLIKLKSIDSKIEYLGFEPNPSCVYYLKELIKVNSFRNCDIIPAGIFSHNGIKYLYSFQDSNIDSSASIIQNFRNQKVYNSSCVNTVNFETVENDTNLLSTVAIIKIDVEGAELEVIKSLQSCIEKYRPIVVIEILPVYTEKNIFRLKRQNEIEKFLLSVSYIIMRINKRKNEYFNGFKTLSKIGIHSNLNECDYVFVPRELKINLTLN